MSAPYVVLGSGYLLSGPTQGTKQSQVLGIPTAYRQPTKASMCSTKHIVRLVARAKLQVPLFEGMVWLVRTLFSRPRAPELEAPR